MKPTSKRGGVRPGSGRKKGSGKGRVAISGSISLPKELWERLDRLRGPLSRGKWIASRLLE
jgi:hypothetical protein